MHIYIYILRCAENGAVQARNVRFCVPVDTGETNNVAKLVSYRISFGSLRVSCDKRRKKKLETRIPRLCDSHCEQIGNVLEKTNDLMER